MHHRFTRFVSLGLVCILMLALVAVAGAQDDLKVIHTGVNMVGGDPDTIDPGINEASQGNSILSELFPALTRQEETTGEVLPGMAESWEVSEDGLTYTYHLVQNVPWVRVNQDTGEVEQVVDEDGNPRFVTADDFVYGWRRTLAPETASPYNYVLANFVMNGAEYCGCVGETEATASAEELGIHAVDEYTLEVQIPEPVSFAHNIHGLWIGSAQPQWAIEEGGDSWTEPEYINTYGPFALAEWAHDESITLTKNPLWPGTDTMPVSTIDQVVFHLLDPATQFAEYMAGTLDAVDVPLEELARVQADPVLSQEYSNGARMCTYYLGFDNTEAPVDNANLRRALSLAVDRVSLIENVTRGGQVPAQWFARPGLAAAPTLETHPDLGVSYDPEAAQEALAVALDELGLASAADLGTLTLAFNGNSGHDAIVQAIQQMWADTLGVEVQLNAMDPTTYFSTLSEEAPTIYRSGWCSDYPDAHNFLFEVMHSESSQNDTGFSNAEFDALVEEARLLQDEDQRRELYARAEEILVDEEAGIIPIYWYTTNQLTRPTIERTYSIIGQERYEKWDIAE